MSKRKRAIIREASLIVPRERAGELGDFEKNLTVSNPEYVRRKRFGYYIPQNIPKHLKFYKIKDDVILLPRNYLKTGFLDQSTLGDPIHGEINITLRPEQQKVINEILDLQKKHGYTDFLLNVDVGRGKTVMAIWLIHYYARRTLVVVGNLDLAEQWVQRVKQFSTYSVGIYNSKKKQLYDVTITTYQYLSGAQSKGFDKLKPKEFYLPFGHIIFDEYHNLGAYRFYHIAGQAISKYRTLLTATFRRKDGMTKIMKYDFQARVTLKSASKGVLVEPVFVDFEGLDPYDFYMFTKRAVPHDRVPDNSLVLVNKRKLAKLASDMLFYFDGDVEPLTAEHKLYTTTGFSTVLWENFLATNDKVLRMVADEVLRLAEEGRNILVLSSRLDMLYKLYNLLIISKYKIALVSSEKNQKYKDFIASQGFTVKEYRKFWREEAQIILGINQLAKEGLDVPRLDTLVLPTSLSDIEQPVGRIERAFEGKKEPYVLYFVYNFGNYANQWYGSGRKKGAFEMFLALGCQITKGKNIKLYL